VLNGRYELRRRLLGGGMGTVWEAYDRILARKVAAKALISEAAHGQDLQVMRERLRREALALALVDHPAVVTVHDLIHDGEEPWIVMGYVDGLTLAQYVIDHPRLPEAEIASIGLVVLQGLIACHAKKVYHRDVKPTNIIRTPEGSARLVDFGIARISTMQTLTPGSKVIGTPEYMAPELFEGGQMASELTDLWSLGATLYYALEGRSPFGKTTLPATIGAIVSAAPAPPPRRPGPLASLLLWMLRKDPTARPGTKVALEELRKIAGSGGSAGQPVWQDKPTVPMPGPAVRLYGQHKGPQGPSKVPASPSDAWRPRASKPLTWLSGKPDDEAAKLIASFSPDRAIADLHALEDEQAAKILLQCDSVVAGRLLTFAAVDSPAWTRKIIEMVIPVRAGQLLNNMSGAALAAALALPPAKGAARVLAKADDATVKAVLSELSRKRPSVGAPLVLTLDDLDAGRLVQVLGESEPLIVARLLHYVATPDRRKDLLGRLPRQFRTLVEKHLAAMADTD
jgi:serine/threonine protein kinase